MARARAAVRAPRAVVLRRMPYIAPLVRRRGGGALVATLVGFACLTGGLVFWKSRSSAPEDEAAATNPSSAPSKSILLVEAVPLPTEEVKSVEAPSAPPVFQAPGKAPGAPAPAPLAGMPAQSKSDPIAPNPTGSTPGAYPGLPAITLSSIQRAGDVERRGLLAAAQWAAAMGDWGRHYTALQEAIGRAASAGSSLQHTWNLEALLTAPTAALAVEQAKFIRAVHPGTLDTFSKDPDAPEFLNWLFARPAVLAAFSETIQPQDKTLNALRQWRNIWADDPATRDSLSSLAIACALVFDHPIYINPDIFGYNKNRDYETGEVIKDSGRPEASALARYKFYRDSAKRGALRTNLAEMTPWELVWVVDAAVPESELIWAQKHVNYSRRDWSKAYPHIRYRMDRATQGVNPYKAYTLDQIEQEGGICGDQAYFAAISAKANGIPAMVIGGEGDRGGHAWFGYEIARNHWDLDTGRYKDNYAAGTTQQPQTGQTIKEHELRQLTDPARRTADFEKSEKLLLLSSLLEDGKQHALAVLANDDALRLAPKNYPAWQMHLTTLAADKAATADWLRESARMRAVFHEFPDLVDEIQKREASYVAQNGDSDAARDLVHKQTARLARKDGERTDLILDSVFHEAELAAKSGDKEGVGRIYRDALREKGTEVVAFKKIASHYYDWAKADGKGPDTVRELVAYFDRKHAEPHGDVFAMGAYRNCLKELSGMAKEQKLENVQERLDRREEKLDETQKKLGKQQSKGADR